MLAPGSNRSEMTAAAEKLSVPLQAIPTARQSSRMEALSGEAFARPMNAVCVTLYNEPWETLRVTLNSLVRAIHHFHYDRRFASCFSTICIIADGADFVDEKTIEMLFQLELLSDRKRVFEDGIDLNLSQHSKLAYRNSNQLLDLPESGERIRFVVCLKQSNAGKLQSHELFFDSLCRRMQPRYCYQVDAGTILERDCILQMVQELEENADVAALAPRVMPRVPAFDADQFERWQYADFAFRKGASWPFELAAGHLSVIPGQFCVVRWHALDGAGAKSSPLRTYLRGVSTISPFEKLMYLAEDRIIGTQLVLSEQHDWRLNYVPSARGTTDACETFSELLLQRRRWNNSALACRVWMLAQVPEFLARSDRRVSRKIGFCLGAMGQWVLALREFFAPAILAALAMTLVAATGATARAHPWVVASFWSFTILDLLLCVPLMRGREASSFLRQVSAAVSIAATLSYVGLLAVFPLHTQIVLLIPLLALIPMSLVLPPAGTILLARMYLLPIAALGVVVVTSMYSLMRLDDVSWGTKGLTRASTASRAAMSLKRARRVVVWVWGAANLAMATYALSTQSLRIATTNSVLAIAYAVDGAIAMLAIGYIIFARWRKWRRPVRT